MFRLGLNGRRLAVINNANSQRLFSKKAAGSGKQTGGKPRAPPTAGGASASGSKASAKAPVGRQTNNSDRDVVFVDGCRTPFQVSGTGFKTLQSWQLLTMAFRGLMARNPALSATEAGHSRGGADRVIAGTVIQEVKTANVAREAALAAGIPRGVPAHTVTMACISSNQAATVAMDAIRAGSSDSVIVGGTETMSDVPIRFSRNLRARMIASQKVRSFGGYLKLLRGLKLRDLGPELPAVAEFSTNEVMGHSADRLASRWGVSRAAQDEYAYRSHTLAAEASAAGRLTDRLAVSEPSSIATDNGIKGDTSVEKLAKLRPAFVKPHGTVTAGSSSFLTDGASAGLIMSAAAARERGHQARAVLRDYAYVGCDPREELLMGPAYAIGKLFKQTGLRRDDVDVWEIHEAFAGQVLANLNAMNSSQFAQQADYPDGAPIGELDMGKLNLWGGSLSLGHPFGSTGIRLIATAANRLHHEDKEVAVVAACAAGGLGVAMLIERPRA